jgi:hypothetical protein
MNFSFNTNITIYYQNYYQKMAHTHSEIIVTARGWSYPSWHGTFYPDDLPEDWRLSYYSNEFNAVVVPATEWVGMDVVEIERWVEDVPEEFLFYLEIEDPIADWEHTAKTVQPLASQLGGFLLRPMEVDADLAVISPNIVSASQLAPVSVLLPDGVEPSVAGKKMLKQYGIQCSWDVGEGKPDWMDSDYDSRLVVVRVAGNKNFTARQWRETIETSLRKDAVKNQTILMVIDSENPKINDMRTAMMIGEMMAVPSSLLQK